MVHRPEIASFAHPAWQQELGRPSKEGRPKGPMSLLLNGIRKLGLAPVTPIAWTSAEGDFIDPTNGQQTRWHLNQAVCLQMAGGG